MIEHAGRDAGALRMFAECLISRRGIKMFKYLKPKSAKDNSKLSKLKLTNTSESESVAEAEACTRNSASSPSSSSARNHEDKHQTNAPSEDVFIKEYHKYIDKYSSSAVQHVQCQQVYPENQGFVDIDLRETSGGRGGEPQAKRVKLELLDLSGKSRMKGAVKTSKKQVYSPSTSATVSPSTSAPNKTAKKQTRDTSKLPKEQSSQCSLETKPSKVAANSESNKVELNMTPELKAMLMWQKVRAENLDCDYVRAFSQREADELFKECERTLTYYSGELAQVKMYGKRYDIPRKQVAHGDTGVTYTYSGVMIPAKPWTPVLNRIKDKIQQVTQHTFNFVLINRYEDGNHYMGEHRDDEKDLRHAAPIASVSFGCTRDFVFRHADSRGAGAKRNIPPIKLQLEHGSLLVMKYPTNVYWYHALPVRKKAKLPRINLTFRDIITKESK